MSELSLKIFLVKPVFWEMERVRQEDKTRSQMLRQWMDAQRLASYPGGLKKRNKTNTTPENTQ